MRKASHIFKLPYVKSEGYHMLHLSLVGANAIRDTTIAGYPIPKGTFVGPNLPNVHEDEREWPESDKFKPKRFLDEDGKFVGWNKLHGFMPFNVGRRECPGQTLAGIMMFSFSSMLLHYYKFELPEGAETPITKVSRKSSL
ncbi:steroid 17-alpha-hydroxylase 17,20 lyase-like, partial [Paramuricea clavata]